MAIQLRATVRDLEGTPVIPDSITISPTTSGKHFAPSTFSARNVFILNDAAGSYTISMKFQNDSPYWNFSTPIRITDRSATEPLVEFPGTDPNEKAISLGLPVATQDGGDWILNMDVTPCHLAYFEAAYQTENFTIKRYPFFADGTCGVEKRLGICCNEFIAPSCSTTSRILSMSPPLTDHDSAAAPAGEFLVLRRKKAAAYGSHATEIVYVWIPGGLEDLPELNFHTFFHPIYRPSKLREIKDTYPDGTVNDTTSPTVYNFFWPGKEYLMYGGPKIGGYTTSYQPNSKLFIYQQTRSNKKAILVSPWGSLDNPLDDLKTPSAVERLLKEVGHYIRRRRNRSSSRDALQLGRVALSGFSLGCGTLDHVFSTSSGPAYDFIHRAVKEIYLFDPRGSGRDFSACISWVFGDRNQQTNENTNGRILRVYGHDSDNGSIPSFRNRLLANGGTNYSTSESGIAQVCGPFGSLTTITKEGFELNGLTPQNSNTNYLSPPPGLPPALCTDPRRLGPTSDGYDKAFTRRHHIFPCIFMYTALQQSGFPTL